MEPLFRIISLPLVTSASIFGVSFLLIASQRKYRTLIAGLGALAMVSVGTLLSFYTLPQALRAIDFHTLGLLAGMMLLVSCLATTGLFRFLALAVAHRAQGRPQLLLVALCGLTALLSTILDNVTTLMLLSPLTVAISRVLALNPIPYLLAEALSSNIGGTSTLVGDPPNIMIASAAHYTFNDFVRYALPVAGVAWGIAAALLLLYQRTRHTHDRPTIITPLDLPHPQATVDRPALFGGLTILAGVVTLFFLHDTLHIDPTIVALSGATLTLLFLLLLRQKEAPQLLPRVVARLDLSLLLFFAFLFVLVGGLETAGALTRIGEALLHHAREAPLTSALAMLWISAPLSGIVDNVPLTIAVIPLINTLSQHGVDPDLFWWALAFGVGFGGNVSPLGSSAGVVAFAAAEQAGQPISFSEWIRVGVPVTIASLLVASGALVLYAHWWLSPSAPTPPSSVSLTPSLTPTPPQDVRDGACEFSPTPLPQFAECAHG